MRARPRYAFNNYLLYAVIVYKCTALVCTFRRTPSRPPPSTALGGGSAIPRPQTEGRAQGAAGSVHACPPVCVWLGGDTESPTRAARPGAAGGSSPRSAPSGMGSPGSVRVRGKKKKRQRDKERKEKKKGGKKGEMRCAEAYGIFQSKSVRFTIPLPLSAGRVMVRGKEL